jgi:hypothetical protein
VKWHLLLSNYAHHQSLSILLFYVDILANEIYTHPADFEQIFQLIFKLDEKFKWRAAWACQKISEKHPEWFNENHFFALKSLVLSTSNGGLLRGCLSMLNNITFPKFGNYYKVFEQVIHVYNLENNKWKEKN